MNFTTVIEQGIQYGIEAAHYEFGVDVDRADIVGKRKHRVVVYARHAAIRFMDDHGAMTLVEIGEALGGRHYSTIHSALRATKCAARIKWELKARSLR